MKILIADDDVIPRWFLQTALAKAGHEVVVAHNGAEAWQLLQQAEAPRLAILDWLMPDLDGVDVCRKVRQWDHAPYVYLILLTSKDQQQDIVAGLEAGADDYLTKPFGVRELIARIGAIMRRCRRPAPNTAEPQPAVVISRDITLDVDKREATVRGTRIELTKQEFDLLYRIAARPGIVYSRTSLLQNVWSDDTHVTERTVDSVISRLRRKVEIDPHHPRLILTAWGIGYKFADVEM